MKVCSVYIFNKKKDRRNVAMYQKLAELICRVDGFIRPQNIAEARKADRFYNNYDDAYENNKETPPYFETKKRDLFLWVEGQYYMNDKKYLYEVAKSAEETELIDKVLIGYTYHYEAGSWFRETDDEVPTRDFGKATELMRKAEYKVKESEPHEGEWYYFIQGEDGTGFTVSAAKVPELFGDIKNFFNRHIVSYEFAALSQKEAEEKVDKVMMKPCIEVDGLKIHRAYYYGILFLYFRRTQKSTTNLPANFWDWLVPDKEEQYFKYAMLYEQTHVFMHERSDEDVA